ncbi:MAG: TolB-like 6-bladed beta-propeller domain-containing protein, partial [Tannerella sp.]|nr:TolB-like 6-bladed beta-propeller domain-containing protein [Tannerella sp.]
RDITSSHNNIYALFLGISAEEGDVYYANRIRVFDWNGENRFEILTDYPIKRIAVDREDNFLYGISHDEEKNPIIVCFDLKELR